MASIQSFEIERMESEITRLTADVEGLKALNAAYHASVGKVCSQRDRETIRAEKAEAQRDALLADMQSILALLRQRGHRPWADQRTPYGCKDCGTTDCEVLRAQSKARAAIASTLATQQGEGA